MSLQINVLHHEDCAAHRLICRSWNVWYSPFGVNGENKFNRSHAHLFHMVKDATRFTFNTSAIRVPSARQLVSADRRGNPDGRLPDDTWILRSQDLPEGFRPDDTWYFPHVARRYVGYDISDQYVAQVRQRLSKIQLGDLLVGAPEPLVSAPSTADGNRLSDNQSVGPPRRKRKRSPAQPTLPGLESAGICQVREKSKQLRQQLCGQDRGTGNSGVSGWRARHAVAFG